LNTLHLKYAIEVAKTGSITLAAENLYMNQPNLSKAIKELETSLGIDIFRRTSKGIVPTKKGEEFLTYAENILAQVEAMEAHYSKNKVKKITFSISIPRASYISHAYTRFVEKLDKAKEWELNIIETNSMKTVNDVAEGECNLGIIRYKLGYESYFLDFLKDKKLKYESIGEFEYLVLMSSSNPLASMDTLTAKDLNHCVEILHGDLMVPHLSNTELKKEYKPRGRRIFVYERGSQLDLLNEIPDSFMFASPIPKVLLERYGLIQKKCTVSDQKFKDVLIYPKGYQLTEYDRAFINEVKQVRDDLFIS
jgi:DNA-binding transcriptional LysR family regulator